LQQISQTYQAPDSFSSTQWAGEEKDSLTVFAGDRVLYLVGLGKAKDQNTIATSLRSCVYKNKKSFSSTVGLDLHFANAQKKYDADKLLAAGVNGILLGRYSNNLYKTDKPRKSGFLAASAKIAIFTDAKGAKAKKSVEQAVILSEAQLRVFDLVNKPANKKIPATLVAHARSNAKSAGYKLTVFSGNAAVKKGFHALHAVGQASPNPSAMIVMDYKPKNAPITVALVGKGVTFDTGGVSLKPSSNMHLMKSDMGGAAAVLGAMEVIAKMKLPVRVVGVVASAENNIGSTAIKPGDIINSYSGKTIEVLNTDAEGRLVLADGLAYAKKAYKPDIMIDLATLTGSIVRAIGKPAAGLFTKNDELSQQLYNAGLKSGERLWPMPMWDEYADEMKSDIADIKNLASSPNAGSITAAKFLEVFTDKHPKWAHLDIAGQAMNENEFSNQANATGFGVHLLVAFVKALS
ncbi:MAG TPA: leucyl aminopeptidase, partial [Saprospiraceae bacterium]|nr:leucyl aminopeptidase [Saprospiraceae bacterium]